MKRGKGALQFCRGGACRERSHVRQSHECIVPAARVGEAKAQSNGKGAGVAGVSLVSKWRVARGKGGGE